MDQDKLLTLLNRLSAGTITADDALRELKDLPFADLDFARVDSHRCIRQGFPEVIYCPGKTAFQIAEIAQRLKQGHELIIATKADAALADQVETLSSGCRYYEDSRSLVWGELPDAPHNAMTVTIVTAGTADIPVAEESALFLQAAKARVNRLYDVGVAGIHRLFANMEALRSGVVTIVVAGMDGALPSVVAGILDGPVIAVPTSIGYGSAFGGIAPLLSMLNSCAAGLTVVNIDNGFGAAAAALRVARVLEQAGTGDRSGAPVGSSRPV